MPAMRVRSLSVSILLIVLLLFGLMSRIAGMVQYNLGMLSIQHGLLTSNPFERQDSLEFALHKLEAASHGAGSEYL